MPIGTGAFIPQPKFSMPRSYLWGFAFNLSGYIITQDGNTFYWNKIIDPLEQWTIKLLPQFYNWSSNVYTLDYVVTDFYLQFLPDPAMYPQPYTLRFAHKQDTVLPVLTFQYASADFATYTYFELPAAPPGYWRPPFLGA